MVKRTEKIRRQIADELFKCAWLFCELALKGLSGHIFNVCKIANQQTEYFIQIIS